MPTTQHEAESSGVSNNLEMHDWIAVEVSLTVLKELPEMIDRIADRLIVRLRERITAARTIERIMETIQGKKHDPETLLGKRKAMAPTLANKRKTIDSRSGQQNNGHRMQEGNGRRHNFKCFKCGQLGHMSRDCLAELKICYNYSQAGHVKINCPSLGAGEGATTEGCVGQPETKENHGRIFKLTADDTQATPQVVSVKETDDRTVTVTNVCHNKQQAGTHDEEADYGL